MKITYQTALQDARVQYAAASGRVDANIVKDVMDFLEDVNRKAGQPINTPRRICPKTGCHGEMTFVNQTVLRPGRKDAKPVDIYTCKLCKNSIMEDVT